MAQEILLLRLPVSIEADEVEGIILERLAIPKEDFQVVEVKDGKVQPELEKKLKKAVLKLVGKHAKYHEELIEIRELTHRYGFRNYFRTY